VKPPFPLGQVVATPGALDALGAAGSNGYEYVQRHAAGDWGNVDPQDAAQNDRAIRNPHMMMLSEYTLPTDVKIWVITDGGREVTTLLLPEEY
jgi:hypothetical protein